MPISMLQPEIRYDNRKEAKALLEAARGLSDGTHTETALVFAQAATAEAILALNTTLQEINDTLRNIHTVLR